MKALLFLLSLPVVTVFFVIVVAVFLVMVPIMITTMLVGRSEIDYAI